MSSVADTLTTPTAVRERRSVAPGPALAATGAIVLTALYLTATIGPKQAILFAIGLGAGLVLYHAAFGFTSSWRVFIADRRGAGLRAQMLMLAITCAVFFPLLSAGELFGQPVRGNVSPAGVAVVVGAFLFGIGMQLGGGCASGTLFSVGGGNLRMVVTLAAFILGSVIGTANVSWWQSLPALKPLSLVTAQGPFTGLAASLVLFGIIAAIAHLAEQRRHGRVEPVFAVHGEGWRKWLHGPWPLAAGAIGLAVVNVATLGIAGRPWGVTSAFALWGAKAFDIVGVPVASWEYWSTPAQRAALRAPVLNDVTTVMNVGIMLGALMAAILANRFAPSWKASRRSLAAALAGGLLLGYGARLAYGCNIGAYFSGIASGSLHGWVWLVAAFAGNAVGVRLRPLCDLSVERSVVPGVPKAPMP
jgi:uncharacterized membrane protein YedE/YeeE